ncbi:MAG: peptidoglycan editing factor PgeF [Devosiaceae bacterium]|nr:peptidoglycan editing factor PgeF [Devosiaceae bacterium]
MIRFEQDKNLIKIEHVNHGFFGRLGEGKSEGDSQGEREDFNCSYVISKDPIQVKSNRSLAANMIGGDNIKIAALSQIHSNKTIIIDELSDLDILPKVDGMVSATKDIALAILTADCAPVLFADKIKPIIGAAHAGWEGALGGIIENTILAMEKLGANRGNIIASIGPTISGDAYEIGSSQAKKLILINPNAKDFIFAPKGKEREHFNLPAFVQNELKNSAITDINNLNICTYSRPEEYFSHRYFTHHKGNQGRQISIISL